MTRVSFSKNSAIFAKNLAKNSQISTFSGVGLKHLNEVLPLHVSLQSNKWLIFSLWSIFQCLKITKFSHFQAKKSSQKYQNPKEVSSDPDSNHIGLPPTTNHSNRKTGWYLKTLAKSRTQTYKNKSP